MGGKDLYKYVHSSGYDPIPLKYTFLLKSASTDPDFFLLTSAKLHRTVDQ